MGYMPREGCQTAQHRNDTGIKEMISRNLRIALIASLSLHVFLMSAVVIVTPGGPERKKPYTRVNFLGPILKKTAFDIMLESANPIMVTTYNRLGFDAGSMHLKVEPPARKSPEYSFSFKGNLVSMDMLDFLSGTKAIPGFSYDFRENFIDRMLKSNNKRGVVYKPDAPVIMSELYGNKESYPVKVRAFVASDGNVLKTEPVTTTGYPQLDIIAAKFVESWIFEPGPDASDNEPVVVEVILTGAI